MLRFKDTGEMLLNLPGPMTSPVFVESNAMTFRTPLRTLVRWQPPGSGCSGHSTGQTREGSVPGTLAVCLPNLPVSSRPLRQMPPSAPSQLTKRSLRIFWISCHCFPVCVSSAVFSCLCPDLCLWSLVKDKLEWF